MFQALMEKSAIEKACHNLERTKENMFKMKGQREN